MLEEFESDERAEAVLGRRLERAERRLGNIAEQKALGRRGVAVIELQSNRLLIGAEDADHEVLGAKWTVDEPQQGRAALLQRRRRQAMTIDRDIHQESILEILVGFLNQRDAPGDGRLARITRPLHGLATYGLGVHVVPEGALIAPVEGFQIDDRAVLIAWRLGSDPIVRKALGADTGLVRLQLCGGDHQRKAQTLDAGEVLLKPQRLDIVVPLRATHLAGGLEQTGSTAQRRRIGHHTSFDGRGDIGGLKLETLGGPGSDGAVGDGPGQSCDHE